MQMSKNEYGRESEWCFENKAENHGGKQGRLGVEKISGKFERIY